MTAAAEATEATEPPMPEPPPAPPTTVNEESAEELRERAPPPESSPLITQAREGDGERVVVVPPPPASPPLIKPALGGVVPAAFSSSPALPRPPGYAASESDSDLDHDPFANPSDEVRWRIRFKMTGGWRSGGMVSCRCIRAQVGRR